MLIPVPVPIIAQAIIPANDGTGTTVTSNGNQFNITGGQLSGNCATAGCESVNLFHSFSQFNLNQSQIANFISNPNIRNILGRINSNDPSYINGLLQVIGGNSNLYLMNPAGIIFGPNAALNVPASFTATTANAIGFGNNLWFNARGNNNWNLLTGTPSEFRFDSLNPGSIVNLGNLSVNRGESLNLLAGNIINTGTLSAPGGNINIVAVPGSNLLRISQPGHLLNLEITPVNDSNLRAKSLPELLTGSPIVSANQITVNPDGSVTLTIAQISVPTQPGTVMLSGKIDVSDGENQAGKVMATGPQLGLFKADINASGNSAGAVLIGGDYKGQGNLPNAEKTFISRDSNIKADGINFGSGGNIIIWSEKLSQIYGNLSVQGGSFGGNGGFIETSSKGNLQINTTPNISAPAGKGGTWLIDPYDITIVTNFVLTNINSLFSPFTSSKNISQLGINSIYAALTQGDVIISTGFGGLEAGNIIWNAGLDFAGILANRTLTLNAQNDITFNQPIVDSLSGGRLSLVATANRNIIINSNITTEAGAITLNANALNNGGTIAITNATINSNGGNISLGRATNSTTNNLATVQLNNAILNAGAGNISIQGADLNNLSTSSGISITNNSQILASNGNITSPVTTNSTPPATNSTPTTNNNPPPAPTNSTPTTNNNPPVTNSTATNSTPPPAPTNNNPPAPTNNNPPAPTNNNPPAPTNNNPPAPTNNNPPAPTNSTPPPTNSTPTATTNNNSPVINNNSPLMPNNNSPVTTNNNSPVTTNNNSLLTTNNNSPVINNNSPLTTNSTPTAQSNTPGNSAPARVIQPESSPSQPAGPSKPQPQGGQRLEPERQQNNVPSQPRQPSSETRREGNSSPSGERKISSNKEPVNPVPNVSNANPASNLTPINRAQINLNIDSGNIEKAINSIDIMQTQQVQQYTGLTVGSNLQTTAQLQKPLQEIKAQTGILPVVIYVFSRPEQLDLIIVPPSGSPIHRSVPEATREKLLNVVAEFRKKVTNPVLRNSNSYQASAQQLYQWLIAPIEVDLQKLNTNMLIFSMDAGLRFVPISALYDGRQFLIEKYSVGIIPSLNLIDTSYQSLKDAEVLAFGASVFPDKSLLPAVPLELETIVQNQLNPSQNEPNTPKISQLIGLWPGKSFLNETFTLENLKQQRHQGLFKIIHLATHAEFKPGDASNSYIQLWNSKLLLNQIRELGWNNPPVELLVLSACRTAQGDEQAELGFAGLAVQAGVKSALASLWYVSDTGTLALMSEFYRQLKQPNITVKAEALRQAQIGMIRGNVRIKGDTLMFSGGSSLLPKEIVSNQENNLSHPYYWSAFTIIGSPW